MKILKAGKLPPPRIRYGQCEHCGAKFIVEKNDKVEHYSDQRDSESFEWIECPTKGCHNHVRLPGFSYQYD